MDRLYEETLLFDFYGELLTQKQRQIFEEVVLCNCSLGEVAEDHGISRQGVHDTVRRCGKLLASYEEKLGLMRKFLVIKKKAARIHEISENEEVRRLADEILEEL